MKKAKRLLAIILAVIMIASASCLPVYARKGGMGSSSDYRIYGTNSVGKYFFTVEQGATYVLDLLDNMLAEANLILPLDKSITVDGKEGLLPSAVLPLVNVKVAGKYRDYGEDGILYLNSIDNAILELEQALSLLDSAGAVNLLSPLLGDITKILGTHEYLSTSKRRGTAPLFQDGVDDIEVLFNLINWLYSLKPYLVDFVKGEFSLGSILEDLVLDDDIMKIVKNLPGFLKDTIYSALVDDSADTIPSGMTVDAALQKVVDWALITGTGVTPETGANSILGENMEAFLPAIANQPGQAAIDARAIQADRDGDGVPEAHTMSFYQLVSNAIQALLSGMLKDLLTDVLYDALDVDPSVNDGKGDPALMSDVMFNTIVGAVEGLCVQNGAPPVEYTDDAMTYPVPKINCLLDWFFMPNGGLATLIRFDYYGVHVTDNFMSLLNDIARLAPGLLGGLLEMELPESIVYSSDELNAIKYVNSSYQICDKDDPDVISEAFLSYEKDENGKQYQLYVSEYKVENDVRVPKSYGYVGSGSPVNITDASRADYINPTFIRSDFVIPTSKVWASLLKVLLNDFIEGCYFPEWADSISSAGAYALASMAATILPEENFIERLDRYHYEVELGQTYQFKNPDKAYDAIPYEIVKADPTGKTPDVVIPKAALDIGAAIGAFYLNGVFDFKGQNLTVHGTTLEQFAVEFLMWGFYTYLPMLAGQRDANTGLYSGSPFSNEVNAVINACYSDPKNNILKSNPNFDSIYGCIDAILFGVIPADWLPARFASSYGFLNGWLLNAITDIDIQQILSLLSVNDEGELNNSVAKVVINLVARVLGLVFAGTPILQTDGTSSLFSTNPTCIDSFDELLSKNSLAALVNNLLEALQNKGRALCVTVFPLLLSAKFVPAYDEALFGTDLTSYKIADLQAYIDDLDKDVNGVKQSGAIRFEKRKTAESAAETLGTTVTEIPLSSGLLEYEVVFPDHYATEKEANLAARYFDGGYATSYVVNGETLYYVYARRDYLKSATKSADLTDDAGTYHTYSNFNHAELTAPRSASDPITHYDDEFRFFEAEDFSKALYNYNNYEDAIDDARDFISDYEGLAKNDLPAAYAAWSRYSIQARLAAANLYDVDGDGVADANKPSAPSAMYPFTTTGGGTWSFYDEVNQGLIGRQTTVNKNEFTTANYEVLAMAVAYANDPANVVVLPDNQAEEIVRLALGTLNFDITANTDGSYTGSLQWGGLSGDQISQIGNFCATNGYTLVNNNGAYTITRKPFDFITSSWTFGISGENVNPVVETKDETDVQKLNNAITEGYDSYVSKIRQSRLSLYNQLNEVGKRVEQTENARNSTVDITSLVWAKKYTESAYINSTSGLRNQKIVGVVNGVFTYSKIYTSASYQKFQDAYDFANSVLNTATGAASAGGLTQSIISKAYMGLIKAYQALAPFSGEAKWQQLDKYIALAQSLTEGYSEDDENGYTVESYNALMNELSIANDIRLNSGYDCESQDIIDNEANDLIQAINSLAYKVQANIISSEDSEIEFVVITPGARIVGQVYNLEEGVGLTKELVKLVGMYEDYESGKSLNVVPTTKGLGTGASYQAYDGQTQKFYYVAVLFGDINGDTRIDGTDKSSVNYYLITGQNTKDAMGDAKFEAADVNHDGNVDENDAKLIEDHYNYRSVISQSGHSSES